MFSKLALFATASLALLVAASPLPGGSGPVSQCDTGAIQCCQSVHQSDTTAGSFLLGAVGVPVQGIVTSVGFACNPITLGGMVGGAAGTAAKCAAQPVCCNKTYFGGLVGNGCIPLNMQVM